MPKADRATKAFAYATILVPALGTVSAISLAARHGLQRVDIGLLLGMYVLAMLGITMGYHRLFAHRSFRTSAWGRTALAIGGSMAAQGPVLFWAAIHRRHHQRSDRPGDPHSPVAAGETAKINVAGPWHAHVGWMLDAHALSYRKLVPDLMADKTIRAVDRAYPLWVLAGLVIPAVIGRGPLRELVGSRLRTPVGGLVRIFVAHHVTWCNNSLCHFIGTRPFDTPDLSRNNFVLAVLTFGEGWHNSHNASPSAARHGVRWRQLDAVFYLLRMLERLDVLRDLRVGRARTLPDINVATSRD
jgi:stearoyl-CoA desaturase (delta-9 desaturase)